MTLKSCRYIMSHLNFFNLRKGISENTETSTFFLIIKIYLQIFHVILTRKKYINMSHIILPKLFFLCFISTNSQSYNRHHQSLSTPPQLFNLSQWLLLSLFRQLFPILKITYLNLLSRIALLFDHYFSPISKHTAPSEANLKLWLTQAEEDQISI